MKRLTLSNIAAACKGELYGLNDNNKYIEATCVEIDSRKVISGGIFIATKGERVDGHDFIAQVAQKEALGVVCEKAPTDCDIPYVLVKDSFQALKDIAAFYRDGFEIPVIGITGSVGKTSTKEFIAGTLSAKYNVCKTQGNFNNEVGMPLTLLSVRENHEIAVVEMGISDFGEMTRLTSIAKPDTCVITNIGQCHLENLVDRDGVLRAKTEIFQSMNHDGQVYVNGDDDKLCTVNKPWNKVILHYGLNENNEIYATDIVNMGLRGSKAKAHVGETSFDIHVPLPGIHMVYNALVSVAIAKEYGLSEEEIIRGVESVKATAGRSNILTTSKYILIDDCYNANPVSMKAAVDLLSMSDCRKVAILGDMFELGEKEKDLHFGVGEYAAANGVECLVCVGELSKSMADGARTNNAELELYYYSTVDECLDSLKDILKENDSILVKASHGMHFERIVEFLKD